MDAVYGGAFVVGVLVIAWLVGGFALGSWKERQAKREEARLEAIRRLRAALDDPDVLRDRIRADVAQYRARRRSS